MGFFNKKNRSARKSKRAAKKATRQQKRQIKRTIRQKRRAEVKSNRQERRQEQQENRQERKSERNAAVQGKKGLGRAFKKLKLGIKDTKTGIAEAVHDTKVAIKETKLGQIIDNAAEARLRQLDIRVWPSRGGQTPALPERELPEVMARPDVAICFSGGGARSAVASFGQMRALRAMGLDTKLRYTSSISGGAWFAVPYSFLPDDISDDTFFGQYLPPENIKSIDQLRANARDSRFCLTWSRNPIWAKLSANAQLNMVSQTPDKWAENWPRVVGGAILKPLGLFDSNRVGGLNRLFTWSNATRDAALARNKFLEPDDFRVVEKSRPYPIVGGVLSEKVAVLHNALTNDKWAKLGKAGQRKVHGMSRFEMTPLYSGVPTTDHLHGGGYIESFGQDSAVREQSQSHAKVKLGKKYRRFSLSDVVGITGSAIAFADDGAGAQAFTPDIQHWRMGDGKTRTVNAVDGGYLEGLGLVGPLVRKVKKVIVCANTDHKNSADALPPGIEHLFDETMNVKAVNLASRYSNHMLSNQKGELEALRKGLAHSKSTSGIATHCATYDVVANAEYGIEPYTVEILWYFLDAPHKDVMGSKPDNPWPSAIHRIQRDENMVNGVSGSLSRFPHYRTARLNLSEEEVSLLANYTHWSFLQMEGELKDFMK